ncbi:MAG: type II secretion system ATPase GspE [Alphaproteobacteria bacterium]
MLTEPQGTESTENFEQSLGERLIAAGKLDQSGLERARRLGGESGERIDIVLTKLGIVSEADMAEALSQLLGLPLVRSDDYPETRILDSEVSARFLKEARVMPLAETTQGLMLAMADPLDSYALKAMELTTGKPVLPRVAVPAEVEAAIERAYGGGSAIAQIVEGSEAAIEPGADEDIERLRDLASEAPVVRMVNLLIANAVEARASDIHIEPFENALHVRYRIDGVLREVEAPPNQFRAAVISRVKLMAKLNIAERRLPQDGRVKLAVRGEEIDFRVSTVPAMHGESVVMRILHREQLYDLAALGFGEEVLKRYQEALTRPHGIILVTGPTGSGKTTTLYASLSDLNTPDRKILTVEDPIEYQLEGVNQIQVRPQIGLSFANVLRSILRQDPDIIMIGEIRDLETAEIAVQAALTGHLVLSTLHTNNASSTITRLLDMGVEDYLMTSTVNAIVAQRLVRTLCRTCCQPFEAMPELIEQLNLTRFTDAYTITLHKAVGCAECNGTGYRGRTTILEALVMSDAIRRLILRRAETAEIEKAAANEGMTTMFEDGMVKALAGITTLEEVVRVTRIT